MPDQLLLWLAAAGFIVARPLARLRQSFFGFDDSEIRGQVIVTRFICGAIIIGWLVAWLT